MKILINEICIRRLVPLSAASFSVVSRLCLPACLSACLFPHYSAASHAWNDSRRLPLCFSASRNCVMSLCVGLSLCLYTVSTQHAHSSRLSSLSFHTNTTLCVISDVWSCLKFNLVWLALILWVGHGIGITENECSVKDPVDKQVYECTMDQEL